MPLIEPARKRVVAFVDGQNLFFAARDAFGHRTPNYDAQALATEVCAARAGWDLKQVRFYTGVPDAEDNPRWNRFWASKLAVMGRQGVVVYSRSLRYRNRTVKLPDQTEVTVLTAEEKGIDVRIAVDIIRAGHRDDYDVALVFSQDQDLSEVADEIRIIAREQGRWIKIASAFPISPTTRNRRGINSTDWIRIDRQAYDRCLDRRNYLRDLDDESSRG